MKLPAPTQKQRQMIAYGLAQPYSIIAADMRLGKAQPVSSPVLTPTGFKPIGSLRTGDFVVGQDGKQKKVLGVFPQGQKHTYAVTFNDGRTTLCCEEHLWSVATGNHLKRRQGFKVHTTLHIKNTLLESDGKLHWAIPHLSSPAEMVEKKHIIHPWVMGFLLGDGGLSRESCQATNSSEFMQKKAIRLSRNIEVRLRPTSKSTQLTFVQKKNGPSYLEEIRRLGINTLSKYKHIPEEYLYDSVDNRIELLRGLMDTDGYVMKDGTTQFTSSSERLVDDTRILVETLGGIASKRRKMSKCQTGVFPSWTLTIRMPPEIEIVTKPEKKHRLKTKLKYVPRRRFKSVDYIGVIDSVCISVEDEHYLTDGCIVTHNTRAAIEVCNKSGGGTLVVCPAYLVANWKKEIKKWSPASHVTTFKSGKEIYEVCDTDFVVISYDLVQKAEHLFSWAENVIADECHHLKNMASKKSQFFHRCIYENGNKRFIGLTGTPIKNRVKEFYSLIALTNYDPRMKESPFLDQYPDEITFAERFSYPESYEMEVRGRTIVVTNYRGLRNSEELKSWLKGRYIRIRADAKDLPPISYLDTLVSDIDDKRLLEAFQDYFRDDQLAYAMSGGDPNKARKLRTSSVLPEHKKNAALQKVPFTIKYVEDLVDSVDCCLVYSDHREPVEQIAAHFKVPAITGSTPAARRSQLVNDFQSGKLDILVATIGSLKEGADLYRAKDLVMNDPPWVPGDIQQVVNRMRAIGHKEPRTVHRILGSPQDAKIWEVLEEKMKTINKAT